MKKRLFALVLALGLLLCGCGKKEEPEVTATPEPTVAEPVGLGLDDDIVILYTTDVHCAVDDNLGYSGLSAVKRALELQGKHVVLVDSGDALQGDSFGMLSQGEFILDIMNSLGYAVACPGDHDFDYGIERLLENVDYAEFPVVSCNFVDKDGANVLDPYYMLTVEGVKLAFVGITTPDTLNSSVPSYFQNDRGKLIYGFSQDETGEGVYAAVQAAVDEAKAKGAQYVIALAHLGTDVKCSPWTSSEVIKNTKGIDVMLDGHSHEMLEKGLVENKAGGKTILSSAGAQLSNIGCLTIKNDGSFDVAVIGADEINEVIGGLEEEYDKLVKKVVASSPYELAITDAATGDNMVGLNETNLGDLCADAYRDMSGADIAIVNGGSIQKPIVAGEITYGDIMAVQPQGYALCVVEATGQEIVDALELGVALEPDGSNAFLHVSGLNYTIDLKKESAVKTDEAGMFVSVDGERRITNVTVGEEPIDLTKTYTLASHSNLIMDKGDGFNMFADNVVLQDGAVQIDQVLINYIVNTLGGVIGENYSSPYGQSRIIFILPG